MHKPLPDFKSHEERDQYFREHADYFTIIKADGPDRFSRDEQKTLEAAEKTAQTKITIGGGRYLIYAVVGEQSAWVKNIGQK